MNDEPLARTRGTGTLLLGIFLTSVATLHMEILQTRIFSVLLWHHITYLVVTFTLLGFAASGTFVTLFPGLLEKDPGRFLTVCSLLFAVTTHVSMQILGRSELDTLELLGDRVQYLYVLVYYLYLVVPYFLAGLVIVGGLRVAGRKTGALYGANLVGSAIGSVLFAYVLGPLGGEGSVFLAAGTAALAAVSFAATLERGRPAWLLASGLVAALSLGGLFRASDLLPFESAPSKVMLFRMAQAEAAGQEPEVLHTRWDPLCRIDVVDLKEKDNLAVYQDADAPTSVLAAGADIRPFSIYNLSYYVGKKQPKVLVIGVGGGQDLRYALSNQASSITGVEINRTTAGLMRDELRDYSGAVYERPGVTVFETEGRSFVRRSDQKYDLIQMTGTDTYAALSSGSYVLSESYLYTIEAFEDYFHHLTDEGMVAVLRFRFFPPRESLRLVAIAVQAMRELDIEHPEQHVLVMDYATFVRAPGNPDEVHRFAYSTMLFRKQPFTAEAVSSAVEFARYDPKLSLAYAPGLDVDNEFLEYFEAVADGTDAGFEESYRYRIDPVGDDSPFFFNFHRWSSFLEPPESKGAYYSAIGDDPIGLLLLGTALVESFVLVALLVILPLVFTRRVRMPLAGRLPVFLYFLGLGVGFLFLEIACMQRLSLYLGHPTRSITVVLFSFLLFSGIGAAVAGRWRGRHVPRAALAAVLALIALYIFLMPVVLDATLGLGTTPRILLAGGLLAVPSFFMGMPFPGALARLQGPLRPYIPWAFAINGGASVVASVAAIFLAMSAGFTAVFWCALAFYALSFAAAGRLSRLAP